MATQSNMSEVLVTRRPIFDRSLELAAYEIVVADGATTADAISRLILAVAAESDVDAILGNRPAWLRLSTAVAIESATLGLPTERIMVELLKTDEDEQKELDALRALHARGYKVAIEASGDVESLVSKVDIATVNLESQGQAALPDVVERLKKADVSLAATNVESPEQYQAVHGLGFDLFRGSFFAKPRTAASEGVPPSRLAVLRLLAALQEPSVEIAELARLLSQDVALTYRLLRYINSAYFGLRREVTSLSHALQLLGLNNVKRWAMVVMLANVDHQPRELLTTALVRARFCELIGPSFRQHNAEEMFTLGLFSVLDALMDVSMARALRPLPLRGDMVEALTLRRGPKGEVLGCALAAERGEARKGAGAPPVAELAELYRQALQWATETEQTLA